jgi:hypothetical protein
MEPRLAQAQGRIDQYFFRVPLQSRTFCTLISIVSAGAMKTKKQNDFDDHGESCALTAFLNGRNVSSRHNF